MLYFFFRFCFSQTSLLESKVFVSCSLIHAYAVGKDMEEGIEMSLVTYSFIVGGFSKAGNAE